MSSQLQQKIVENYNKMNLKEKDDFVSRYVLPKSCPTLITMSCIFFGINQTNQLDNTNVMSRYRKKVHDKNYNEYFLKHIKCLKENKMASENVSIHDPKLVFECVEKLMEENYLDQMNDECMKVMVDNSLLDFDSKIFLNRFRNFHYFLKNNNTFCFLIAICQFFHLFVEHSECLFHELLELENFGKIKSSDLWSKWKDAYNEIIFDLKYNVKFTPTKFIENDKIDKKTIFKYVHSFSKQVFSALYFIFVIKSIINSL